jgi:hypothetical protein
MKTLNNSQINISVDARRETTGGDDLPPLSAGQQGQIPKKAIGKSIRFQVA